MLLGSCDAGANGITYPKSDIAPHFNNFDQGNVVMSFMLALASHDTGAGANGIDMTNKSYNIPFWLSLPNKCNGAIDNTIGIMWHWNKHHWHQMTKNVLLHIVKIILT